MPISPQNAEEIARQLTPGEREALLSLPARDRGDLPDDLWWAYYANLDAGLSTTDGNFLMMPTPLGHAVLAILRSLRKG